MPEAEKRPEPPSFNPHDLMDLYRSEKHDELAERFLAILRHFDQTTYISLDQKARYYVDAFLKQFLYFFTQHEFQPKDPYVLQFVRLNWTVSNLVAISSFKTTDPYVELLRNQEANFFKLLTLYSARNTVQLDRKALFDTNSEISSVWYCAYGQIYRSGMVSKTVCENLKEHFAFRHPKLSLTYEPQDLYFGSTYVPGGVSDRAIKPAINEGFRKIASEKVPKFQNTPNWKKIAVMSSMWFPNHSVYRILSAYIKALEGFHITFVRLGKVFPPDTSMFDEVHELDLNNGVLDVSPLIKNDYGVIYYPDIGMSPHSILLANMRIAPIQMFGPGHPVSTWGGEIDYFVGGADCDPPENPERNYSERLILLPGSGAVHNKPLYEPVGRKKACGEFVINCPWFAQKINYAFLETVREIIEKSEKRLRFRIFVGSSVQRNNDHIPFTMEMVKALPGAVVEVVKALPYPEYMGGMEEGDIALDSYHFGGGNVVTDNLYLRKPMVTYEGSMWYNRIGSQSLRLVGLPELIATNDREYVKIAVRLINDDRFREKIQKRLARVNLDETLFNTSDAKYFQKALEYLIENHERLKQDQDKTPILIER